MIGSPGKLRTNGAKSIGPTSKVGGSNKQTEKTSEGGVDQMCNMDNIMSMYMLWMDMGKSIGPTS